MTYLFVNVIFTIFMVWFSFHAASSTKGEQNTQLSNLMFFLACICALMTLTVFATTFAPDRLIMLLGKVYYSLMAIFLVHASFYCACFPELKKTRAISFAKITLDALAIYICFLRFDSFSISSFTGLNIVSKTLFYGKLSVYFPYTYYDLYKFLFIYFMPGFTVALSLVRAENQENKIDSQRLFITCLSLLSLWPSFFLYDLAQKYIPMVATAQNSSLIVTVLLFYVAAVQSELWNIKTLISGILQVVLLQLLPAIIVAGLFVFLWTKTPFSLPLFLAIVGGVAAILMTYSHETAKLFAKSTFFRSSHYADVFENEIANIDFNQETQDIIKRIQEIFTLNVGSSALHILIDSGHGDLTVSYSSTGLDFTINTENLGFDTLLNNKRTVVFRRQVNAGLTFGSAKPELLSMLNTAHSDALIVLNEGRHIVGAIFLGPKLSQNVYSDYDYKTFNKLYSYFFVLGYYIRNIANQSVIGTVNREIKMSGQIISSIQQNMDFIKNPQIDVGYLMQAAHNIGGEFIDFIKLNDTKHIFVIGDLSGKGISASMNMVILKSIIRTFLSETKDFKLLVQRVNDFIRFSLPKGSFFAGLFGLLDFADNTMYYINCAAPTLMVYTQAYNNVIEVQGEGRVLGFVKDITPYLKIKKVHLEPGDIVFSCTDGLIESHSLRGDEFGKSRVQQAMMENSSYSAQKMTQFVFDAMLNFTKKDLEDDVSILVLKINRPQA